jgi:hypothetical protein
MNDTDRFNARANELLHDGADDETLYTELSKMMDQVGVPFASYRPYRHVPVIKRLFNERGITDAPPDKARDPLEDGVPEFKFVLDDDGNPVPQSDLIAWATWYEANYATRCQIRRSDVDGLRVSTVFLPVGFAQSDGTPPPLFETKIFDDADRDIDHMTWKAPTMAEALMCHEGAVGLARLWLDGDAQARELVRLVHHSGLPWSHTGGISL